MEKNGMTRELPERIKFAENDEESYNWKDDMDDLTSVVSDKLDSNASTSGSTVGHV